MNVMIINLSNLLALKGIMGRKANGEFEPARLDCSTNAWATRTVGELIASKRYTNIAPWSKIGFNAAVTTEEIISPQGAAYVFPTVAQEMHILGGAEDKVDGTGIRALTVYYLNASYQEKSVDIVPTATTGVSSVVTDIFRVQNIRAKTVGGIAGAAGAITLRNHAETVTYGHIAAGNTRQRQLVWTVPANKTLYISQLNAMCVHTAANKRCIVTLRANYDDKADSVLTPGLFFMPFAELILENSAVAITFDEPLRFPEKTDIIIVGASDGTATVSCAARGYLENNC